MIGVLFILSIAALEVNIEACADADEIRRIVVLELGEQPGQKIIQASCVGETAYLSFERRAREVDLRGVDIRARARLIALAAAELAASKIEFLQPKEPEPPPSPESLPQPSPESLPQPSRDLLPEPQPSRDPRPRLFFAELGLDAFYFPKKSPLMFGGRGAFSIISPSGFGARADLRAARGTKSITLGTASMFTLSTALTGFRAIDLAPFELELGTGLRIGYAHLTGSATDPQTVNASTLSGTFLGPLLAAELRIKNDRWSLLAGFEGGLVVRPVVGRVNGEAAIGAEGAWLSAHVGAAFDL